MSMNVGGDGGGVKSEINVTPLVDVMLVLLIIMMIIAPLLQQGAPLTLPTATNTAEKPETQEQTVVSITSDKRFYLNSKQIPKEQLQQKVIEALEAKTQKIVIIKADIDAEYGSIMEAMDTLRAAGIEDMGLITDPKRAPAAAGGGR